MTTARGRGPRRRHPAPSLTAVLLLAGAMGVAGCGAFTQSEPLTPQGLACIDDSGHCMTERRQALFDIMADKDRRWIRQSATPSAYASGVRLFAMKQKKREFTCEELALARREADAGPGVLRGAGGAGLTPAQVSRGILLAEEVADELKREQARRCKT